MPTADLVDRPFADAAELCATLRRHYWRRAPVVFRNHGLGEVFGGAAEILEGLRSAKVLASPPRIYGDGHRLPLAESHWCTAQDDTLAAYVERLSREHGCAQMLVLTDAFERNSARIWFRTVRFLRSLYEAVGFPAGDAQINVFAGSYARTPFGFHKDVADSLTQAIAGAKRYLVWPYDVVARHLPLPADARHENIRYEKYDYARVRSEAIVMDTLPGDLFYWPWDCFHIAEPDEGELSVSISFGIVPFASPFFDAAARVAKRLPCSMRDDRFVAGVQADPAGPHVDLLHRAIADDEVTHALREELLFRRTRFGFKQPLPAAAGSLSPLADDDVLVPPLPELVAWVEHGGGVFVAVNGRGFGADAHPGLAQLLGEVNRGVPLRVGDLRARYCASGIFGDDELDDLLHCLLRFHALRRDHPRPRAVPKDLFHHSGLFPLHLVDDGRAVSFARIADDEHRRIEGFEVAAHRVPLAQLFELHDSDPPVGSRPRWIFTQGYSGSTLVCRCVDAMTRSFAVHEPAILDDWALHWGTLRDPDERRRWLRVLDLVGALLFRSSDGHARVVVKVGPHVPDVMAEILEWRPATAVHLHASLPAFLANTLKDGDRRASLRAIVSAPQRAAMLHRIGAPRVDASELSDAQAIAYLWLTDVELYRWMRARPAGAELRALEFDGFLRDPARGLRALARHLELELAPGAESTLAASDLFRRHAKPGRA
ncbi:MAG TPA: hypothetical protein VFG69_05710, partial [Nannocystaceae bacterium]|nr:hypothetical protein [Nannocystaceae bacterium]